MKKRIGLITNRTVIGFLGLVCLASGPMVLTSCSKEPPQTIAIDQVKDIDELLTKLDAMPADQRSKAIAGSRFDIRVVNHGTPQQKEKLAQLLGHPLPTPGPAHRPK